MSLRNFHVDANASDAMLLAKSDGIIEGLIATFRQAAANGNFKSGGIEFKDPDLNRVHSIINEIDSRRLFYNCSDDEIPKKAMESLFEVRKEIRGLTRGVWANPSVERIIQEITAQLNDFATKAELLNVENMQHRYENNREFWELMTNMRLTIWFLVGLLKNKLGSVLQPRNLPHEIEEKIQGLEI